MRKAISWLFIAAFLITAPLLLLYTLGYRYNLKRNTIQSTGALSLISIPKGASVTLNGVRQSDRTPLRMTQLNPGIYTLEMEKEGFSGWRRQVTITPGTHTVFAPIRLFPLSEPIPINDAPLIDRIVWRREGSSWIIASMRKRPSPVFMSHLMAPARTTATVEGDIIAAAPEPHDLALAVLHDTPARITLFFLSLTESLPTRTVSLQSPLKGIDWIDQSTLLAWNDETLFTLTLDGKVKARAPLNAVRDAQADDGRITVLTETPAQLVRIHTAENDLSKEVTAIDEIALSPESTLVPHSPHGLISIFDPRTSTLALIAADTAPQFIRQPGVRQVQWAGDRDDLLMVSEHELQLISWSQSIAPETTLLTRVAESISSYLFAPALNAVFFTTPTRLAFIHLNPAIDQEPHTLSATPALEIIGADPSFYRLYIKKGEQLLSYPLQ